LCVRNFAASSSAVTAAIGSTVIARTVERLDALLEAGHMLRELGQAFCDD
jgi:hypothetical protein